jgi:chromosome segregation ATPase
LLEGAREELDALRNVCTGREREVEITRRRAGEAEIQVASLKKELDKFQREDGQGAKTLTELEQENADLRQENETLNHQVMLLLADDETTSPRPRSELDFGKLHRRQSAGSVQGWEDHTRNIAAELQEWEQKATPTVRAT